MTQDFFMGQLRLIAVGLISYLAGSGRLTTADASLATTILAPIGLLLGPWLWSLYRNAGMKLVPHDSIAIAPDTVANAATAVKSGSASITSPIAKVVGAVLIALALSFAPSDAFAQVKLTGNVVRDFAPAPKPATSVDGALQSFGDGIQKIEKALVDKGIADLTAAITDATNHNDNISLPCWKANLALLQSLPSQWENPPSFPIGIALGIQIQRDLLNAITGSDEKSLKVACAALWGDQLKIVANVGALIGIRVATGGLF